MSHISVYSGVSAKFKFLSGGVEFVREIAKSPTWKILRKALKEMALKSL